MIPSNVSPKVAAGGVAGGVSVIVVWAIHAFGHVDIPPEIASAFTTVISGVAAWFKKS